MTAVSPKSIAANIAPIAIGWSVLLAHLVMIPWTGCGINPARSAGPHIVAAAAGGDLSTHGIWTYYTAPFVGAGVAALVSQFIFGVTDEEETSDSAEKKEEAKVLDEGEGEEKEVSA